MLRILVVVFFWLCAIGVLSLSIWAEVHASQGSAPSTPGPRIESHGNASK